MADWGLYTALRGTDNWAQRRQDKMMNLKIAEQQRADEEKKVEKSMLAEEKINEYLDEINKIDVLPEDQERIQEVERQSRQSIVQGIANYNGDLTRYISSGGITDLHEYKNSITESVEVKTALQSKENMAKIIKDKQEGRYIHPISYTTTETDEEGNEVEVQKRMTPDQQITAFKNGDITSIDYNGSEKKVPMNAMTFHNTPKDPQNPYSDDNLVTTSDIKFWAMSKGASEEYADNLADNYKERYDAGGDPWYWGNLSPEQRAIDEYKAGKGRSGGGSGKTMLLDPWKNSIEAIPQGQSSGPITTVEKTELFNIKGIQPLSQSESVLGGSYRTSAKAWGRDTYGTAGAQEIDLSTAEIIDGDVVYSNPIPGEGQPPERMMEFTVVFPDDSPVITTNDFFFINDKALPGEERNFVNKDKKWTGRVMMSIEDVLNNPVQRGRFNKVLGMTTASEFTPPSQGNYGDDVADQRLRELGARKDEQFGYPPGTSYQALVQQQ